MVSSELGEFVQGEGLVYVNGIFGLKSKATSCSRDQLGPHTINHFPAEDCANIYPKQTIQQILQYKVQPQCPVCSQQYRQNSMRPCCIIGVEQFSEIKEWNCCFVRIFQNLNEDGQLRFHFSIDNKRWAMIRCISVQMLNTGDREVFDFPYDIQHAKYVESRLKVEDASLCLSSFYLSVTNLTRAQFLLS